MRMIPPSERLGPSKGVTFSTSTVLSWSDAASSPSAVQTLPKGHGRLLSEHP